MHAKALLRTNMAQVGKSLNPILTMRAAIIARQRVLVADSAEVFMISDLPTFAALRERMRFLQTRQKLLAENVANADTPGYKPKDIRQLGLDPASRGADQSRFMAPVKGYQANGMAVTDARHIAPSTSDSMATTMRGASYETRPSGNAVELESEMLKVSQNQIDFQTAANLYQRSLSTMKIALGKKA
jgi:flagellar basal-body rod protein FlgB